MRRRMILKVLAVLEIIGGVGGPAWLLFGLVWAKFPTDHLVGAAVGTAIFLLSLFAGVMLWRDRPVGYLTSAVVQFAQLLKIATPQFAFMISLGGDVSVVSVVHQDPAGRPFRVRSFNSHAGAFSVVEFGRAPGAPQAFGVSIVSCLALAVLRKGRPPATDTESLPGDATPAPLAVMRSEGEPDWVLPVWLKIALVLFGLVVICCGGLTVLSR